MRACFSFFRMRLLNGQQYRTAAWAGVMCQFFWGFMEIRLYYAFYQASPERFAMTYAQTVSYIWLRQALFALLDTWVFENELFDSVLKGDVAYELCRPVSLYGMWFARSLALRFSRVVLRCGPLLLVSALLPAPWGMRPPASPWAFTAFLLSMLLAACVNSAFNLIVYFSCFYTLSSDGIRMILLPFTELFSGGLIPLPFMPETLARIVQLTPFGAMQNAPLRIYSGHIAGAEMGQTMLLQVFWLAVLGTMGYVMQQRGLRRLCVQGG